MGGSPPPAPPEMGGVKAPLRLPPKWGEGLVDVGCFVVWVWGLLGVVWGALFSGCGLVGSRVCGLCCVGVGLFAEFVECYGGGGGHVEGVDIVAHGDADHVVGVADDVLGEAVALGAHDDGETRFGFQGGVGEWD